MSNGNRLLKAWEVRRMKKGNAISKNGEDYKGRIIQWVEMLKNEKSIKMVYGFVKILHDEEKAGK